VQEKVVQPAKDAFDKAVTTAQNIVATAENKYEEVKTEIKQKWGDTKQWVQTKVEETKKNIKRQWENTKQAISTAWISTTQKINESLHDVYDYHGPVNPPSGVTGQLWLAMPGVSSSTPYDYILKHYYVNQQPMMGQQLWPSPNECVTAATIQNAIMMQDILAAKFGIPAIPHIDLPTFAAKFDALGPRNWVARPPADVPIIGGMLSPKQAERVLNAHGEWLRENYGCGYTARLTWGNTPDDLISNLQNGYPTSIHISQQVDILKPDGSFKDYRALFGGVPHTFSLAGYDATTDTWKIIDPAGFYKDLPTAKLMGLWGRQFIGYPPRFAMTTLISDATCAQSITTVTPTVTPSTPTGTSIPSQTVQPRR